MSKVSIIKETIFRLQNVSYVIDPSLHFPTKHTTNFSR